jgi:hypothetical protein
MVVATWLAAYAARLFGSAFLQLYQYASSVFSSFPVLMFIAGLSYLIGILSFLPQSFHRNYWCISKIVQLDILRLPAHCFALNLLE